MMSTQSARWCPERPIVKNSSNVMSPAGCNVPSYACHVELLGPSLGKEQTCHFFLCRYYILIQLLTTTRSIRLEKCRFHVVSWSSWVREFKSENQSSHNNTVAHSAFIWIRTQPSLFTAVKPVKSPKQRSPEIRGCSYVLRSKLVRLSKDVFERRTLLPEVDPFLGSFLPKFSVESPWDYRPLAIQIWKRYG